MWHAKPTGGYAPDSEEAFDNAMEIFKAMYNDFGWTRAAVLGMLGNTANEGGFNPWRWEADDVLATSEWRQWTAPEYGGYDVPYSDPRSPYRHGGGLWGFTPYDKYLTRHPDVMALPEYGPNFRDREGKPEDGYAQCYYIAHHGEWVWSRIPDQFPQVRNIQEYSQLDLDAATMAAIWVFGYEGPADPWGSLPYRAEIAEYFDRELPLKPGGIRKKTLRLLISRPKYPWWIK